MIDLDVIESVLMTDSRYLDMCDRADSILYSMNEDVTDEDILDDLEDYTTDLSDDDVLETTDVLDDLLENYMDDYCDLINDDDGKIIDIVAGMD